MFVCQTSYVKYVVNIYIYVHSHTYIHTYIYLRVRASIYLQSVYAQYRDISLMSYSPLTFSFYLSLLHEYAFLQKDPKPPVKLYFNIKFKRLSEGDIRTFRSLILLAINRTAHIEPADYLNISVAESPSGIIMVEVQSNSTNVTNLLNSSIAGISVDFNGTFYAAFAADTAGSSSGTNSGTGTGNGAQSSSSSSTALLAGLSSAGAVVFVVFVVLVAVKRRRIQDHEQPSKAYHQQVACL